MGSLFLQDFFLCFYRSQKLKTTEYPSDTDPYFHSGPSASLTRHLQRENIEAMCYEGMPHCFFSPKEATDSLAVKI